MNEEFENALAWFRSAPEAWIQSARKDFTACAQWIWEVLQGDFNDEASTAQVATGTIISMIPFVDQICDIRDIVANATKINDKPSDKWHWVALILTLIGLFPTIGSLVKGCGKVMFASMRKAGNVSGATPRLARNFDVAVSELSKFLSRPEVARALKTMKVDNPFSYLATEVRKISAELNVKALRISMESAIVAARRMLTLVEKWGNSAVAMKAKNLLAVLENLRQKADSMLPQGIRDGRILLDRLARRLDLESDMAHRAHLNAMNPHAFSRHSQTSETAAIRRTRPAWANFTDRHTHRPLRLAPTAPPGWPSTTPIQGVRGPLDYAHKTFKNMNPVTIPPGTRLYRILDPNSSDNSICWMSEQEFIKLKSKDDWRRRFAVWANWNKNGEFVIYDVPPGKGINVWEGVTASQKIDGENIVLEGGARQIVIHPDDLEIASMGKRQKTGWGFDDFGESAQMIGVPQQKNNWFTKT